MLHQLDYDQQNQPLKRMKTNKNQELVLSKVTCDTIGPLVLSSAVINMNPKSSKLTLMPKKLRHEGITLYTMHRRFDNIPIKIPFMEANQAKETNSVRDEVSISKSKMRQSHLLNRAKPTSKTNSM